MYLRSITMKGFKSFPERTSLEFSPGVSVIVGPNGSGKSNITDAVLWALGEQSPGAIRGASMQDVISAGGKGVGQRRAAEVEVVIDNSDGRAATEFSEIAVERRLDRSGDSGYRLNGARCRLADVTDVLSDTNLGREMHSVISQGRVETIVHSKPRERRLLVEEAAGLGKHRKRRRRAELKLRAARDNLDRALDVEREARARLRPLKRQAQAAELGARIEREELGLRGQIVSEELRFGADRAAAAEKAAAAARKTRGEIEEKLSAVSKRRREAEERFAARDRERTQAWGLLTKLRGEQERIAVRAVSLSSRATELEARLESLRAELGPLTLDVGSSGAPAERARKLEEELGEVGAGLDAAVKGLDVARSDQAAESAREKALGDVRSGAERASRHARRAEGLLGERHREALRKRLADGEALLDDARAALAAVEGVGVAIRARVERTEGKVVGGEGDGDEIAEELRACSQQEFELQAEMSAVADELTKAEVEAAHLGDRRAEAERELATISERLGEEVPAAEQAMSEEERAEIDRRLERLERRRAQIGPVNPLAEREYDEAREHVESLQAQREDTERAMRELETLIRDIDTEIERAFEQTFDATAKNFEEMVEHLFPGGRGVLRRVSLRPVRDEERPAGEQEAPSDVESEPEAEEEEEREELGVEIEVTPAGKSTRKLSLLSGGEKSLVALAFVFAVFLARPCPFYILDEVEAALDDANIDRFLQLIRRFSDRAQFVIVTHQKRTMDAADVLYGVSMGGDGITKVVSRRLPREAAAEDDDEEGGVALSAVA
ncbi:MAG TPA: chromosome segregation SMC family protein [Solirubrobacterales bacterium]|nr:chromosome segregation SMC family protein [Solirubrobacterales bacterium]